MARVLLCSCDCRAWPQRGCLKKQMLEPLEKALWEPGRRCRAVTDPAGREEPLWNRNGELGQLASNTDFGSNYGQTRG